MPEYILFLAKLKQERRKAFSELASIDLSSKLFLTCRGTFNNYKSVHHLIPTLPVGIGNTPAIFRTNQKVPRRYVFFWVIEKEREKYFCRVEEEGQHCEITLKSTWLS